MTHEQNEHRQQQVESLYQRHYTALRDLASEDPRFFVHDIENVMEALSNHLNDYDGQFQDGPFLDWAMQIIRAAVARLSRFYALRQQYSKSVLKGVWSVLQGAKDLSDYDDPGRTARALADNVWCWAFQNIEKLDEPGSAALSTRLQAKAAWQARAWKTARLRERARTANLDVAFVGRDENGRVCVEHGSNREES